MASCMQLRPRRRSHKRQTELGLQKVPADPLERVGRLSVIMLRGGSYRLEAR